MPKSGSAFFPFADDTLNQCLRRAENVKDILASAIRAFLITEPGSRRGNPIGSFLPSLLHRIIPSSKMPQIEDELRQELTQQFPGVVFTQVAIKQELTNNVSTLKVNLSFSSPISDLTELSLTL